MKRLFGNVMASLHAVAHRRREKRGAIILAEGLIIFMAVHCTRDFIVNAMTAMLRNSRFAP